MNLYRPILLIASVTLLAGCEKPTVPPGGFSVQAKLSHESMLVGDVLTVTLTARHPAGSMIHFPPLGTRKEVVVRGQSTDTRHLTDELLETEEIVQLTSLRVGNWLMTTNPVTCSFNDGSELAKGLPPLMLKVGTSLTDENAGTLSDIKGPMNSFARVLKVFGIIGLVALIAGLITLLIVKKRPAPREAAAPVIPPHIRAQNALHQLKNKAWIPEPFFVDLSRILRTYLDDRFQLNAPECTTEELSEKLPPAHQGELATFFEQSDLVKFARADAQQDVMQTAFSTVKTFVEQTTEQHHETKENE